MDLHRHPGAPISRKFALHPPESDLQLRHGIRLFFFRQAALQRGDAHGLTVDGSQYGFDSGAILSRQLRDAGRRAADTHRENEHQGDQAFLGHRHLHSVKQQFIESGHSRERTLGALKKGGVGGPIVPTFKIGMFQERSGQPIFELIDGRYARAARATEGRLETVPGCAGLQLDLDEIWDEISRLDATQDL